MNMNATGSFCQTNTKRTHPGRENRNMNMLQFLFGRAVRARRPHAGESSPPIGSVPRRTSGNPLAKRNATMQGPTPLQTTKLANGANGDGFEPQSAQRNTEGFPIRVHPRASVVGSAAPGAQNATFHGLTPFEVSATTNCGTILTAENIKL